MRSLVLAVLLGALVACENSEDQSFDESEVSEEQGKVSNKKKDLNTIIRDINPYGVIDEDHPFYDIRIEGVESLLPKYIEPGDYTIKKAVYGGNDIAILQFWDKKPLCMVLGEKDGVGELVVMDRSENINLQLLAEKHPEAFSAKGYVKYGDQELKTNFAIATTDEIFGKPAINIEFSKTLFEGDIEVEAIGFSQKKTTSFSEPSFDISISYDEKKKPSQFSINHHKLWDGTSGHSMPSGEEVSEFKIENGMLKLKTSGDVNSHNDTLTEWDVDIELPIFESGCEVAFK